MICLANTSLTHSLTVTWIVRSHWRLCIIIRVVALMPEGDLHLKICLTLTDTLCGSSAFLLNKMIYNENFYLYMFACLFVCLFVFVIKERKPSEERIEDQKAVDEQILPEISKEAHLKKYLKTLFSLRKGQYPHSMIFWACWCKLQE